MISPDDIEYTSVRDNAHVTISAYSASLDQTIAITYPCHKIIAIGITNIYDVILLAFSKAQEVEKEVDWDLIKKYIEEQSVENLRDKAIERVNLYYIEGMEYERKCDLDTASLEEIQSYSQEVARKWCDELVRKE